MAKKGEREYLKNIGEEGIRSAYNKPFSESECGGYLMQLGAIMSVLPPPPARLLDLGCGTGWTSCFFARRGYEVTGQDIAADMIEQARKKSAEEGLGNIRFVASDYEEMGFEGEFDCAVFFDSLHHAVDEEAAVRSVYRALKPGGLCVTAEPGVWHERRKETKEAVRKYDVTEKDTPPSKVIRLGKSAGFRKFRVYPHARTLNLCIYAEPGGFIKKVFSLGILRDLAAVFTILVYKRLNGIVSMVK
ncbi:MAG TPA: class I SAM-dependent methyltransferase [Thermodesulfobacteriota bacterium]|nr:class I SAM-dependent methyltransferase [Thermodesulfobacteriota bacterium]